MPAQVYRVVVSENQNLYPDRVFIDFAPAQSGVDFCSTHDMMLHIRRKYNPEVSSLTDGLLMYDFGNNEIRFKMEQVTDRRLKAYQEEIMARHKDNIIRAYHNMRASGAVSTLRTDTYSLAEVYPEAFLRENDNDYPRSAREEYLREEAIRLSEARHRRESIMALRALKRTLEDEKK